MVIRTASCPKSTMRQVLTGSICKAVVNIVPSSKNFVESMWDRVPSGRYEVLALT